MLITCVSVGEILLETLFLPILFEDFGCVFLCETKRMCIGWILGQLCDLDLWPYPWAWPCSCVGGLIDMERKGCEVIIHDHERDLWVTMVGWEDVPYSDWGDFRRRRAFDISSFLSMLGLKLIHISKRAVTLTRKFASHIFDQNLKYQFGPVIYYIPLYCVIISSQRKDFDYVYWCVDVSIIFIWVISIKYGIIVYEIRYAAKV